jgi:hypothetical protein
VFGKDGRTALALRLVAAPIAATTATPTTSAKIRVFSDFIRSPLVGRYLEIRNGLA